MFSQALNKQLQVARTNGTRDVTTMVATGPRPTATSSQDEPEDDEFASGGK